jgi:hypothetical protein
MSESNTRILPRVAAFAFILGAALILTMFWRRQTPAPDMAKKWASQTTAFVDEKKWNDAIPLVKQQLQSHPEDIEAHFRLGQCYLYKDQPAFGIAEGEFKVALQLFHEDGDKTEVAGMSAKDFELQCTMEVANVFVHTIDFIMKTNVRPEILNSLTNDLEIAIGDAKRLAPDDPRIKRVNEFLQFLHTKPWTNAEPKSNKHSNDEQNTEPTTST